MGGLRGVRGRDRVGWRAGLASCLGVFSGDKGQQRSQVVPARVPPEPVRTYLPEVHLGIRGCSARTEWRTPWCGC